MAFEETNYLADMYRDPYFPDFLVDKVKHLIKTQMVEFFVNTPPTVETMQTQCDLVVDQINDLQEEFDENGSEIEAAARESIAETFEIILNYFNLDLETEEAIRNRDW